MPGIADELALMRRFLPAITVAEISAFTREFLRDDNRVVLASTPEKEGVAVVTEGGLRDALRAGNSTAVEAWRDEVAGFVARLG